MITRRLYAIPLLLAIGVCLLIAIPASAETEPNDSLLAPEVILEGTFSGSVTMNGSIAEDVDVYRILVPADMDIEVSMKKTDTGTGSIKVTSYDHNQIMNYFGGISMTLTTPHVVLERSDYNSYDIDQNIYIMIEGEGDYEMVIEFTTATADAFETLGNACMVTFIVIIVIIVVIIGLVIFFIIFFKKKGKKEQASQPGVQVQSNILRSDVVDVSPPPVQPQGMPPQQPQYQPQTPPPQQQQYPPQQQQMVQQPVQQQPAVPPVQQPQAPPVSPPPQQQMVQQPVAQQPPAVPPVQQPAAPPVTPPPQQMVQQPVPQQQPAAPPAQPPPVEQPRQAPVAPPPPQ